MNRSESLRSDSKGTWTRNVGLFAVAGLGFAGWMLNHPYRGLEHDAVLYAVLALARLHPAALGHDFFVRFGAQDGYTLFGPLYAATIRSFGLEPAAAITTAVSQLALLAAAWLLAVQLMSKRQAVLAVGLLMVLPSWYGSNHVFAYVEEFITPRLPAEAAALLGLAAALRGRHWLAAVCMAVALALHPIIAAAGIMTWVMLVLGVPHPRVTAAASAALAMVVVLGALWGHGPFQRFDDEWLQMLRSRLHYLYPTQWTLTEWNVLGIRVAVLALGSRYGSTATLRAVCLATLVTAGLGLLLTVVEGDLLHVILATQLQSWRWLWLSGAISVLLVTPIAVDCWDAGGMARAGVVLVLAAWLTQNDPLSLLPMLLAITAALLPAVQDPRHRRLLALGTNLLLIAALAVQLGDLINLTQSRDDLAGGLGPYTTGIVVARAIALGGTVPAALLVAMWWWTRSPTPRVVILMAVIGITAAGVVMPYYLATWGHARYPAERMQAFASWRAAIPEEAEILWPDPPAAAWFELGRASYWSLYQMSGMVFSRDASIIGTTREKAVTPILPQLGRSLSADNHYAALSSSPPSSADPCALPGVRFFASWIERGPSRYPPVAPDAQNPKQTLYLYQCHESR